MLDRQKIEAILTRRFPGATHSQVAAATNAIMGLRDESEKSVAAEIAVPAHRQDSGQAVRGKLVEPRS